MIHTSSFRQRRAPSRQPRRSDADTEVAGRPRLPRRTPRRGACAEDGFSLIEVMVSALLVAFIAIATFNGFDVVTRATADQRHHNDAAVLAAQSQEDLRSDSASTLDQLQVTPHTYTQTVGGEKYTITQSAKWVNDNNQTVPCSATSKESGTNQNGSYLQITSSVTWLQQTATGRPALTQTSIITPPDGSGLEIDVTNGQIPLQPVAGVNVIVNNSELTTGEAGCVIFGSIPSTRASMEAYRLGYVTPTGAFSKSAKEVLIAPNITTRYPVTLAEGAAITADFTYEGLTEYKGKKVTGDTFVVYNNSPTNEKPYFEVGSTNFGYEKSGELEGDYKALAGEYKQSATTPISAEHYPRGDLFPFPSSAWVVYAGDCPEDNAHSNYTEVMNGSAILKPGEDRVVSIPMSRVQLAVWEGTQKVNGLATKNSYKVKITNTGCAAYATPNNAVSANLAHEQLFKEGGLEAPFQPFGKYELCLYNEAAKRSDKVSYTNSNLLSSPKIYVGEGTEKEKVEQREKEEKTAKEKREAEEKTAREKAEKTEIEKKENKKATREKEEKTAREKHETEEKTAKEKRIAEEKEEAAVKEVRVEAGNTC
jgi:Tfp pilus assembly protein PilV